MPDVDASLMLAALGTFTLLFGLVILVAAKALLARPIAECKLCKHRWEIEGGDDHEPVLTGAECPRCGWDEQGD